MAGNVQYGELEVHAGGEIEGAIAALPPEIAQLSKPSTPQANDDLPEEGEDLAEGQYGELGTEPKAA